MRWQFSSIFPNLLFISLFFLPLSRPPYHAGNFLLVCVLGLFFVNARQWIHIRHVRKTLAAVTIVSVVVLVSQFISLGLAGSLLPLTFFILGVLSLVPFVYIRKRVGTEVACLMLIGIVLLWAQWGVAQFVLQRDLGFNLTGESRITPQTEAVAKFSVGNQKFIRAYGPFLHANTFGGVTLMGLAILSGLVLRRQKISSQSPNQFVLAALFTLSLGLLVSFSRTAIAGGIGILGMSLYKLGARYRYVPLVGFLLAILFLPLLFFRATDPEDAALLERSQGIIWWSDVFSEQTWWQGVGLGGYSRALQQYLERTSTKFESWQIAPVHSVPLLTVSELGILGTIGLGVVVGWFLRGWVWWLTPFLPALLLDHYFFTQPAALAILLMGMVILQDYFAKKF